MTGRTGDDAYPGNPEPSDGSSGALEGEIIPAGHLSEEEWRKRKAHADDNGWRTYLLDDDDIAEIIRMRVARVPLRTIAKRYNVSHEAIRRWTDGHHEQMAQRADNIRQIRAEQAAQLMTARDEAWKMYYGSDHPTVKHNALTQVNNLTRNIVELLGARVPVVSKTEVTVTEVDPMEIKLREMINEAQAQAAATKAQVEREFKTGKGGV